MRVTHQDIALQCGVTRSTVSKALRNDRTIPESTRKRILEIAEQMGYQRDPAISSLMTQLRYIRKKVDLEPVAWVSNFPERDGWARPMSYRRYFQGAEKRSRELGFELQHFWLGDYGGSGKRLSQVLYARNIRGVLIAPVSELHDRINLDWEHFSIASFGYSLRYPKCHRATNHQYHTILKCLQRLDQYGYRRIGLMVRNDYDQRVNNSYLAGMSVYQHYIQKKYRVPMLIVPSMHPTVCLPYIDKHKPDAVIHIEPRIVQWLSDAGVDVPDQVAHAHLGLLRTDQQIASNEMLELAGVDQNSEEIGAAAIDLIAEQIYENRKGIPAYQKIVQIEGSWCDGKSVAISEKDQSSLDWSLLISAADDAGVSIS